MAVREQLGGGVTLRFVQLSSAEGRTKFNAGRCRRWNGRASLQEAASGAPRDPVHGEFHV
jgi:hypothetical protein